MTPDPRSNCSMLDKDDYSNTRITSVLVEKIHIHSNIYMYYIYKVIIVHNKKSDRLDNIGPLNIFTQLFAYFIQLLSMSYMFSFLKP